MSLIIWQPRQYADGWATVGNDSGETRHRYRPCNNYPAGEPYDKDALIREVTRFTGWTQENYADTGEMEIVIPAGQVLPSDIKKGRMLAVDGRHYVIEDFTWTLEAEGWACTVSGRDFGGRMDKEIPTARDASGAVSGDMTYIYDMATYFLKSYEQNETSAAFNLPEYAGWFRDLEREPASGSVVWDIEGEYDLGEAFNAEANGDLEIVSYGALIRYMCNFYDLGYKFVFDYDHEKELHTVQIQLYRPEDSGVIFRDNGRGVSGFEYAFESRDTVNAAFVCAKSRWRQGLNEDPTKAEEPTYPLLSLPFKKEGAGWHDVANNWSGRVVDCGEVPEENDTSISAARAWIEGQTIDVYQNDTESVAFEYDNSGFYKYGVHFGLGSKVAIYSDYLGLAATQRLYGVKTKYEAGKAKSYEFEFGDQRRTTADKLLKRFAEIDRKTYSI